MINLRLTMFFLTLMQRGVIVTTVTLSFSFDTDIIPGHDSTGIKVHIEVLQE